MTRDGGGWTLIVGVHTRYSDIAAIRSTNEGAPTINTDYSILDHANDIKAGAGSSADFEYRLEAHTLGSFGGIWTAPASYSFVKTDNTQTSVVRTSAFSAYDYPSDTGIEARMPWLNTVSTCGGLTTSDGRGDGCTEWWGTIASLDPDGFNAWIKDSGSGHNPEHIWYWLREPVTGVLDAVYLSSQLYEVAGFV